MFDLIKIQQAKYICLGICAKVPFYSQLWQRGILFFFQNWFDSIRSHKSKVITKTVFWKRKRKEEKKGGRPNWAQTGPAAPLSLLSSLLPAWAGPLALAQAARSVRSTIPENSFYKPSPNQTRISLVKRVQTRIRLFCLVSYSKPPTYWPI